MKNRCPLDDLVLLSPDLKRLSPVSVPLFLNPAPTSLNRMLHSTNTNAGFPKNYINKGTQKGNIHEKGNRGFLDIIGDYNSPISSWFTGPRGV